MFLKDMSFDPETNWKVQPKFQKRWIKEACRQLKVYPDYSRNWLSLGLGSSKFLNLMDHRVSTLDVLFSAPYVPVSETKYKQAQVNETGYKLNMRDLLVVPLNYYFPGDDRCTVYLFFVDRKFAEAACLLK